MIKSCFATQSKLQNKPKHLVGATLVVALTCQSHMPMQGEACCLDPKNAPDGLGRPAPTIGVL